jgi:ABC-type nitrate/sulfonate/bicarbonate transport system permease component
VASRLHGAIELYAFLRLHGWILGTATTLLVLAVWQALPEFGLIDRLLIPPASDAIGHFFLQWLDPHFYADLSATLLRVLGGFLLAGGGGIPAGLAMGYWITCYKMFSLTVDIFRPVPSTALVPIAALIFGIGNGMHIFVVVLATTIPILLATIDGVRGVDPLLIDTARTLGQSTSRIFRTVLLPAAMPSITTGLRVAIAIALIVGISSEMMLSADGLGRRVVYAQRLLQIPDLYAGVLTLAILGFVLNRGFLVIERRLVGWHRGATKTDAASLAQG